MVRGGALVQESDSVTLDEDKLKVVSKRQPSDEEMRALKFAWIVAKHVKSNAIVYARRELRHRRRRGTDESCR